jgi:NAD(P)-dependent dehydrogenase (short-subunit alcohol dehydrogenase family)
MDAHGNPVNSQERLAVARTSLGSSMSVPAPYKIEPAAVPLYSQKMKLKGKTAVVTGGAAGIGLETCRRLVGEGCVVTMWDIDAPALNRARKELSRDGARVFAYPGDVTKPAKVAELARRAVKDMGQADILVNNAGVMVPGTFLEQPVEKWQKTIDVNLMSLLHTIHEFLPGMHARNSGHIVNVSSAGGLLGVPGTAPRSGACSASRKASGTNRGTPASAA